MLKIILIFAAAIHTAAMFGDTGKIDRRATVERQTVKYGGNSARKSDSPSQVGNGKFAFGFDRTGLQTLSAQNTLSDWAWHSTPPPCDPKKFKGSSVNSPKGIINFPDSLPAPANPQLSEWLAANPHRLNLGRIAFAIFSPEGKRLDFNSISPTWQTVNMYTGAVESQFSALGENAFVTTVSHPGRDVVSVKISSQLLKSGKLRVIFSFPYSDAHTANLSGDWNSPQKHKSALETPLKNAAVISRELDSTKYFAAVRFSEGAKFKPTQAPHEFELVSNSDTLEFTCEFSPSKPDAASIPDFAEC